MSDTPITDRVRQTHSDGYGDPWGAMEKLELENADLKRQLEEYKRQADGYYNEAAKAFDKVAELKRQLSEAQTAIKATLNYPGIKEYVGTQITDRLEAVIAATEQ